MTARTTNVGGSLTVKELRDRLRDMRVFNDHEILERFGAEGRDVVVRYTKGDGRGAMCHGTNVYSPTFKTKPDAPWYDHGTKTFVGGKGSTFQQALDWAAKEYEVEAWANSPFGGTAKIPAEVLKAARAQVGGR